MSTALIDLPKAKKPLEIVTKNGMRQRKIKILVVIPGDSP